MNKYYQPDFYHFSEDSIHLVNYLVAHELEDKHQRVLDLCAGCGVVGLELLQRWSGITHLDFVEAQIEFAPFLEKNIEQTAKQTVTNIYYQHFSDFKKVQEYDLIIANPPYFNAGKGRISGNPLKQRCRTFSHDTFIDFINCCHDLKTASNAIYFLAIEENANKFSDVIICHRLNNSRVICKL